MGKNKKKNRHKSDCSYLAGNTKKETRKNEKRNNIHLPKRNRKTLV